AVPMASNARSVATITGNPQNMIIGAISHIPHGTFVGALAPVAAVGLVLTMVLVALSFPKEFFTRERLVAERRPEARYHRALVYKSAAITAAVIVLFFAGQPVAKVAIVGGALLLFTRRVKAEKVYFDIDWPLLMMFVGLFIVVAGMEKAVLTPDVHAAVGRLNLDSVPVLSAITAGFSHTLRHRPPPFVVA